MKSSLDNDITCVAGQRKKRFANRWSLRHLIYSSPLLNRRRNQNNGASTSSSTSTLSKSVKNSGKDTIDGKVAGSSKEIVPPTLPHYVEIHQATSRTSVFTPSTKSGEVALSMECPLCCMELTIEDFWELSGCGHRTCLSCLQQYLKVEISESRVSISCPECTEPMHPNEIKSILNDSNLYEKYEDFMVRRVLAVEPDTRWCPAPDCGFAVIASECASCPKLKCLRPGCDSYFCYHCKAEWHPNQTCDSARAQRSPNIRSSSISYSQDSQHRDDIKPCPRCQVLIVKMDDGSCNHMMCAVCGAEFCWLCMKEISDLHYLSPSGCTFWGKKPWSRKKKILWQLGTLVGAPVGIALVAGITVPAMIIGIPVWVGRKLYTRYKMTNKHKRNAAIIGGVIASVMISPILAGLAVGIGVPILLFYVYGVVPVSLCRSGGCGGPSSSSSSSSDESQHPVKNAPSMSSSSSVAATTLLQQTEAIKENTNTLSIDADAVSAKTTTIDEEASGASLSLASGSQVDRESASTVALAGSHRGDLASAQRFSVCSLEDDGGASTRGMAGSVLNYKTNGSDSCSCTAPEDCSTIRYDNFIAAEKASIGSSCSFRARCALSTTNKQPSLTSRSDLSNDDSICIEMTSSTSEHDKNVVSQTAILRNQFFHDTTNNTVVIVEVAMEESGVANNITKKN